MFSNEISYFQNSRLLIYKKNQQAHNPCNMFKTKLISKSLIKLQPSSYKVQEIQKLIKYKPGCEEYLMLDAIYIPFCGLVYMGIILLMLHGKLLQNYIGIKLQL